MYNKIILILTIASILVLLVVPIVKNNISVEVYVREKGVNIKHYVI
ncbi:hypothetical protein [Terrisporobacter vanillatitrophus]